MTEPSIEHTLQGDGFSLCFACRRAGRCHLGLTHEALLPDGSSLTRLACPDEFEGGPRVAHGGWTAAVMDELLGHLALLTGRMAVTASLKIDFVLPVPLGRPLKRFVIANGTRAAAGCNRGELRLAATGAVLARAEGVFVERDASHFARQQQWLADQDRAVGADLSADRGGGEPIPGRSR